MKCDECDPHSHDRHQQQEDRNPAGGFQRGRGQQSVQNQNGDSAYFQKARYVRAPAFEKREDAGHSQSDHQKRSQQSGDGRHHRHFGLRRRPGHFKSGEQHAKRAGQQIETADHHEAVKGDAKEAPHAPGLLFFPGVGQGAA